VRSNAAVAPTREQLSVAFSFHISFYFSTRIFVIWYSTFSSNWFNNLKNQIQHFFKKTAFSKNMLKYRINNVHPTFLNVETLK